MIHSAPFALLNVEIVDGPACDRAFRLFRTMRRYGKCTSPRGRCTFSVVTWLFGARNKGSRMDPGGFASKVGNHTWTGSVQGAVATWSKSWESTIVRKYRMLITDQVATAPCTDPVQAHFLTLGQS